MKITLHNYEEYIIDYLDDQLDFSKTGELMLFLSEHPEIKEEVNAINDYRHIPEKIPFKNKNSLKKSHSQIEKISEKNIDDFIIADLEGDLNAEQKNRLQAYAIENPEIKKDIVLYSKLVYTPDFSIKYNDKLPLKKEISFIYFSRRLIRYGLTAAAIILFISSIFILNNRDNNKEVFQITKVSEIRKEAPIEETPLHMEKSIHINKEKTVNISSEIQKNHDLIAENTAKEIIELKFLTPKKAVVTKNYEPQIQIPEIKIQNQLLINNSSGAQTEYKTEKTILRYYKNAGSNLISVLNAGIKAFNSMTESEITVKHETDETGKTKLYALQSDTFRFYKKNN